MSICDAPMTFSEPFVDDTPTEQMWAVSNDDTIVLPLTDGIPLWPIVDRDSPPSPEQVGVPTEFSTSIDTLERVLDGLRRLIR